MEKYNKCFEDRKVKNEGIKLLLVICISFPLISFSFYMNKYFEVPIYINFEDDFLEDNLNINGIYLNSSNYHNLFYIDSISMYFENSNDNYSVNDVLKNSNSTYVKFIYDYEYLIRIFDLSKLSFEEVINSTFCFKINHDYDLFMINIKLKYNNTFYEFYNIFNSSNCIKIDNFKYIFNILSLKNVNENIYQYYVNCSINRLEIPFNEIYDLSFR